MAKICMSPLPDMLGRLTQLLIGVMLLSSLGIAHAACIGKRDSAVAPLSIAVVPQLPVATVYSHWAPLLQRLGQETGLCFDLTISASIPEFETLLLSGKPDLAFANPYHVVMAHKKKGYIPLVADGQNLLTGILVARKDGAYKSIADLQGQTVAFPAPNAFAASLLIRASLAKQGIKITPVYVKTHTNVYRDVILGQAAAGGAVNNTLRKEPEEVRQMIQVIYETPAYRPHPLIAKSSLSPTLRQRITHGMIALSQTPEGAALLDTAQLGKPTPVTYQKDYAPLEQLGLEKYVVSDTQ